MNGTNIGSISYYFGNKEGLIEAVLDYATGGWKSHEDVIGYIIDSSPDLFTTADGRLKILRNVFSFLFRFYIYDPPKNRPIAAGGTKTLWRFWLLHTVLSSRSENNPYKKKLVERVMEPNRRSFERLIRTLCPNLAIEEVYVYSAQFFLAPLLHYSIVDLTKPLPFDQARSPLSFLDQAYETLAYSVWLVLENRRER